MADSGGFWLNLAAAQQLTQTFLVPGIIEENLRRGGLLSMLPLAQTEGLSITWNREDTERTARKAAVGDTLSWSDNITYTKKSTELTIVYDQTPLNHFVKEVYGTINNYEAITLQGLRKGVIKQLEDEIIYGDATYNVNEFDGLHAWGEDGANTHSVLEIDEGQGALSLANLRVMVDDMRAGLTFLMMSFIIGSRIDAFFQEVGSVVSNRSAVGVFQWVIDDLGRRIPMWSGVPIIRSDYMVAEEANTGFGVNANARQKHSTGTAQYSILGVLLGQVMLQEPGVSLGFGGLTNEAGELFKTVRFDNLEDFDAAGLRLVNYSTVLAGSAWAVGRILDIQNVAITE